MKKFFFFQILLLQFRLKNPIQNLFYNSNKIGILDKNGILYHVTSKEQIKKYGEIFHQSIDYYDENGKDWFLKTKENKIFYKNRWFQEENSKLLYNQFSDSSFFQVYHNQKIYKDGNPIRVNPEIYKNPWEKIYIFKDRIFIIKDIYNRNFIYDVELKRICYQENFTINSSLIDIQLSKHDNFHYLFFGYHEKGIRCLLFYGGFMNPPIEKIFFDIPNLKNFSSDFPFLISHDEKNFRIFKKIRKFPLKEIKRIYFPHVIENIFFFNYTMFTFFSEELFLLKIKNFNISKV